MHYRPGDSAVWNGRPVLIVDVHGYPAKTVDLRWTESGTSGSRNEVSGHKRKVPVSQLKPAKQAARGQFILVRELPPVFQKALKEVRYKRKDIKVSPETTYMVGGASGGGYKAFTVAVNLGTGRYKIEWGSWGGANMFNPQNPVDLDRTPRSIPSNAAIIHGMIGGGQPTYATISVNPDNLTKLLPETGNEVELSQQEIEALNIIGGTKSGYRKDEFQRQRLGKYGPQNPYLQSLADKGLVKITGRGVMITLQGKNRRQQHSRYAKMKNEKLLQRVAFAWLHQQTLSKKAKKNHFSPSRWVQEYEDEVATLASNNYGPWNSPAQAEKIVQKAVRDLAKQKYEDVIESFSGKDDIRYMVEAHMYQDDPDPYGIDPPDPKDGKAIEKALQKILGKDYNSYAGVRPDKGQIAKDTNKAWQIWIEGHDEYDVGSLWKALSRDLRNFHIEIYDNATLITYPTK